MFSLVAARGAWNSCQEKIIQNQIEKLLDFMSSNMEMGKLRLLEPPNDAVLV